MRIKLIVFILFCICMSTHAMNLRVEVQSAKRISTVSFTSVNGTYYVFSDKRKVVTIKRGESVILNSSDSIVQVSTDKRQYGSFGKLRFISKNSNSSFYLGPIGSQRTSASYYNDLEVTERGNSLRFLNVIGLEKYVEGAVAAEGGSDATAEFYKVQAILCRTYALGHLQRHAAEGFNLCDQVHCQAYKGIWNNHKIIATAVAETKNRVIVDSTHSIIIAAYHSNCGGQTAAADEVWSKPVPYLQSICDPFCVNSLHAAWDRKITLNDWLQYLHKKKISGTFEGTTDICDTTFCYFPDKRESALKVFDATVSARTIREDWRFKSAYFSINQSGDTLEFNGRGYGHGIGLCQEGAMQMAKLGYTYEDIIGFYYRNVFVVDASQARL